MIDRVGKEMTVACREVRKRFEVLDRRASVPVKTSAAQCEAIQRHLRTCTKCALEYRMFALQRAALAAATSNPITPDEDFFRGLRARIARGPELARLRPADESWTAAMLLTARQLLPAMAALLLLMIGATFLWNQTPSETSQAALRPRERVVFSDMYDYPEPTPDDVLETLVAVEERENGK